MDNKYVNKYLVKENHVILSVFGLKHEATLIIELSDYEAISKVHWGLMEVGRKGNKKIIPYTTKNRVSIPLGRWLLQVTESEQRVEHRDRNNHNFLRTNLYVAGTHDYKQQISKHGKGTICGIYEIKQKSGKVTGYKVQHTHPLTKKKEWTNFCSRKYNGLVQAKKEAVAFKMSLIHNTTIKRCS